jgi:hypothetical protein
MAWEPDYITREQLKSYITSNTAGVADTTDNDWLDFAVTAASRAVDRECSKHRFRQFGLLAAPETRYYTAKWFQEAARWVVEIDDLMTTVGMVVQLDINQDDAYEVTVDNSTGYILRPRSAPSLLRPWTQLAFARSGTRPTNWPEQVAVTARWGWTTTPTTIPQATLLQGSRFFARKQAPFGTRGTPEDGSEGSLEYNADPDVRAMLRPYVRLVETP